MKKLLKEWKRYLNEQPVPPRPPGQAKKMPPRDIEVAAPRAPEEVEKMDMRPMEPTDQLATTDITDINIKPKYIRSPHHKPMGNYFKVYQRLVSNYEPIMDKVASKFTKTPEEKRILKLFLAGTMAAESGVRVTKKESRAGARGITQFLPWVARKTAIDLLGMSKKEFNKNWRLVKAGDPRSVEFMLTLSSALYNSLKDPILKKYKKLHNKELKGEEYFNAMHVAYSHGRWKSYFINRLKRDQFSAKGLQGGADAWKYISRSAKVRFYYQDYLNRKTTATRRVPRTPPKEFRSPRRGIENLPKTRRSRWSEESRSPRFGMESLPKE